MAFGTVQWAIGYDAQIVEEVYFLGKYSTSGSEASSTSVDGSFQWKLPWNLHQLLWNLLSTPMEKNILQQKMLDLLPWKF